MVGGKWARWELRTTTRDLYGKTVGLIGFGRTGRAVAKRLRGFEVKLIANDPYITLPEPLPPGNPLTTLDNVVLTPHVAASTLDAFRTKLRFALGNIARVMAGEEPLERVPGT